MSTNSYGLDTRYLCENLKRLLFRREHYTPEEMGRALRRLANAVDPQPPVTGDPTPKMTTAGFEAAKDCGIDIEKFPSWALNEIYRRMHRAATGDD